MSIPQLQLHGQASWHNPAAIVGDRAGLTQLRDALDKLLASGSQEVDYTAFAYDGEGYDLFLLLRDEQPAENHYHDNQSMGGRPTDVPGVVWSTLAERAKKRRT